MKKIVIVLILCLLILTGCGKVKKENVQKKKVILETKEKEKIKKNNFVSYNGNLKVEGTKLKNQYGEDIQLKGISSHGLQWFNDLITEENIKILKDNWNSNVFRLAMYTKEGGYVDNKDILKSLESDIELLIKNDMYIIIDWHILSDNNPNMNKEEAKTFFKYITLKYKDTPNIIYEICNEPNGNTDWNNDVKPYAEEIIPIIRENSKKSIIIVGTTTWSQDVDKVIGNRVNNDQNVMYTLHFYSGTHKEDLRSRAKNALDNGVPIFVSEWGTSDASGDGGPDLEEAKSWVDFMNENNLSFVNWSLTNKEEKSAILKPNTFKLDDENLTESGTFIKNVIKEN